MKDRPSYRTKATLFSAIFLPTALAVGTLVGGIMKYMNPDNVDVWQPLAYLSYFVIPGIVVFTVLLVLAIYYITRMYRAEHTFSQSVKLPLTILVVNLVLVGCVLVGQAVIRSAEDNYAREHDGKTHAERSADMDRFFKDIEAQENKN